MPVSPHYPSVLQRYLAAVIDGMLVLSVFVVGTRILNEVEIPSLALRSALVLVIAFMILGYEPVLTSGLCTLGQFLMRFRVRTLDTRKKISIWAAYVRYFLKATLGIISLFTIPASEGRRAIHDLVVKSIVIPTKSDNLNEPDLGVSQGVVDEMIKTQMQINSPEEVISTHRRLKAMGFMESEALRLIGCAVKAEFYGEMKSGSLYDEARYISNLRALPKLPWE